MAFPLVQTCQYTRIVLSSKATQSVFLSRLFIVQTSNSDYNFIWKIYRLPMYYCQSPFFYPFQPQVYFLPTLLPLDVVRPFYFENVSTDQLTNQNLSEHKVEIASTENNSITTLQKLPETKSHKEAIDSEYEPENNETLIFYKKKNTESNLSNQIYSFISSDRSKNLMLRLFDGDSQKVQEFYKLIKKIKKSNKKYMNRSYITQLVQLKEGGTNFKIYERVKCPLQPEKIRKALRISMNYFLENICGLGLLTSKKMNRMTVMEHFARKRQIKEFIFEGSAGSDDGSK